MRFWRRLMRRLAEERRTAIFKRELRHLPRPLLLDIGLEPHRIDEAAEAMLRVHLSGDAGEVQKAGRADVTTAHAEVCCAAGMRVG